MQHDLKAKMVRMTDSVSEKTQETTEEKHWNTLTLNRNYYMNNKERMRPLRKYI